MNVYKASEASNISYLQQGQNPVPTVFLCVCTFYRNIGIFYMKHTRESDTFLDLKRK